MDGLSRTLPSSVLSEGISLSKASANALGIAGPSEVTVDLRGRAIPLNVLRDPGARNRRRAIHRQDRDHATAFAYRNWPVYLTASAASSCRASPDTRLRCAPSLDGSPADA